ncbi:hypothetical protein EV401DRAFT_1908634, partial [Pisolithus croceorrhizus]
MTPRSGSAQTPLSSKSNKLQRVFPSPSQTPFARLVIIASPSAQVPDYKSGRPAFTTSLAQIIPLSIAPTHPWRLSPNTHCNGGLKNAVDSAKDGLPRRLWVGTFGSNTDGFGSEMRTNVDKCVRYMCDSVPVWIPGSEFEICYDEFCHQVLWPCLHYAVPDAPNTKFFYESASFKQCRSVDRHFADILSRTTTKATS